MTAQNIGDEATLRDYARVVWQRKWLVAAIAVAFTALALAYSYAKTPLYQASSRLAYSSQLNVADPLQSRSVDPSTLQIELGSVNSEIASPKLVQRARDGLAADGATASYTVSAAPDTSASGETGSVNTVSITAVSPDADTASRVANAYAAAFTAARKEKAQAQVRMAEQVVQSQMDAFETEISRLSADYVTLVQRLQDLRILEATVTGNFEILVPATVPTAPYTPKPLRNGAVGFVAGLILGVGAALLLAQFDTRVRSQEEISAILGMPLLAQVRKMGSKQAEEQPLVVLADTHSPTAENIRKLRGNLEFAGIDGDLKSLFVTSALQHEGKTLTVCNLALSLAATGSRVLLVDGDLRKPRVHKYLSLRNTVGLTTVLTGRAPLEDALSIGPRGRRVVTMAGGGAVGDDGVGESALTVLTSGPIPPNAGEIIASKRFAGLIEELEERFDLVIVDAPALLAVGDTTAIAACVDGLVFLVDLGRAKRPLLLEAAAQLSHMPCRKLGLVVLGRSMGSRRGHDHYTYDSSETSSPEGDPKIAPLEEAVST